MRRSRSIEPSGTMPPAASVVGDVVLMLGYYLIATPAGLISRLVRDPLSRKRNSRATTYWIEAR